MRHVTSGMKRRAVLILTIATLAGLFALPNGLTGRFVPSARAAGFTWTGAVSADWFTPGNWSPVGVPGPDDTATINSGTVDIAAGAAATVAALNFNNGTITGAGTLTVTGTLNWARGTMSGTGTTVIPAGAAVNVNSAGGLRVLEGGRVFNNAGTFTCSASGSTFGACVLAQGAGYTFNNSGTLDFRVDEGFQNGGVVNNTGTVRKSGGAGVTLLQHGFNNNGAVEVLSGELRVGNTFSNSTSGGAFTVAPGATLNFSNDGGTHDLTAGSSVSGAGNVTFSVGTVNVNGTYNVTGTTTIGVHVRAVANFNTDVTLRPLVLNGGNLSGSGNVTLAGTSSWTRGNMQGSGAAVIAEGGTLDISAATTKILAGRRLDNSGTINVSGTGQSFGFCGHDFALNNAGTINFGEGGNFTQCNSNVGTINNTGTLRKSAGSDVSVIAHTLNNNGVVEVQTGTLLLGQGLGGGTSAGAFTVASGATLQFSPGEAQSLHHTLTGTSSISGAGNVSFVSGTTHINGAYNVTGATIIDGQRTPVANFNSDVAIPTVSLLRGRFGGGGTVTVNAFNWENRQSTGSIISGAGTLVIPAGGTMTIDSSPVFSTAGLILENGRTINNEGTIIFKGVRGIDIQGTGPVTVNNRGLFDAQADLPFGTASSPNNAFNNTGTFRKSAGSGTTTIENEVVFTNRGAVEVLSGTLRFVRNYTQHAGTTVLAGGNLSFNNSDRFLTSSAFDLRGGLLAGAGVVEGNLLNGGTVSPGPAAGAAGVLTVTENYTQAAAGRLNIEIGGPSPGTQFDQLVVGTRSTSNRAALDGTLAVTLLNNFRPAANDSFEVVRYSSHTGRFAAVNGADIGNGQSFTPDYRPNNLVLVAGATGGDTAGCGGPSRPWVHVIAPSAFRSDTRGRFRLEYRVLYGNSGGRETWALVNVNLRGLVASDAVEVVNVDTGSLVPVDDPAAEFQNRPVATRDANGQARVNLLFYVPPDNPQCPRQAGPPGSPDGNPASSEGAFSIVVTGTDSQSASASRSLGGGATKANAQRDPCNHEQEAAPDADDLGIGFIPGAGCFSAGTCGPKNRGTPAKPKAVCSKDPNEKVGPGVAGGPNFISGEVPLPYAVFFENDPDANAPAQEVVVTDQLDLDAFDLSTFQLGAISFGPRTIVPPPLLSEFHADVDLRPANNLIVRVSARLDKATGLVTWRFTSLDPATLQPTTDPFAGFLPPNRNPPEGEGSLLFTVKPKAGLPSGTQIRNRASIVFDTNDAILTGEWLNTVDNAKPSSGVQSLPATTSTESFTVRWSGADADSGVAHYDVYVSEDGGPFQPWLLNAAETSAVFPGQRGKSYGFYSLARDNTGNAEDAKAAAEAATTVGAAPTLGSLGGRVTFGASPLGGVTVTLTHPGGSTSTARTDGGGFYGFANLAPGDYTVAPSRPHFAFAPPSRAVTLGDANLTGIDFEAASTATSPRPAGGPVLISEFRLSGVTADDEYVELYNNTDADADISGYRLDALSGQSVTVPAGTIMPARSHYLIARLPAPGSGYTLSHYAAPDLTYDGFDLPDATGLALLDAAGRIVDAVGTGSAPPPYREGGALAAAPAPGQHSFVRALTSGLPADAGDNSADFLLVSTDPEATGAGALLGAPGPQNLASPAQRNALVKASLVDPCAPAGAEPNAVRDSSFSDPASNSTHGTFAIRRKFTNMTGREVTRLRFRIVAATTRASAGAPPEGTADLRALSSPARPSVAVAGAGCAGERQVGIEGLTLEELTAAGRPSQPRGGGWNSTLAAGTIALESPLAPGDSRNFEFLLGVEQRGAFRFFVNVEALAEGGALPERQKGGARPKSGKGER